MQEEVENRTVTLIVTGTRFTGRMLKEVIGRFLRSQNGKGILRRKTDVAKHGKMRVKDIIGQGQGTSTIEIKDKGMRDFDRVARKYGVDYAIRKDRSTDPPTYSVFFKSRDADALTSAFKEYSGRMVKKHSKTSVLKKLKELVGRTVRARVRNKERER